MKSAVKMTSIRLDMKLAEEAKKVLGAKNKSEAIHIALREVAALGKFKELMSEHGGKLKFKGHDK